MTSKVLRLTSAVTVGLTLVFGATAAWADSLRYCNEADFPPFSYQTAAGEVEGFDIDVANYICDHMGVDCDLVVQEWTGIFPALASGRCDAIISSLTINEERKQRVLFSKPYYQSVYALVAPKDVDIAISEEGLQGKTFCMFKASTALRWLEEHYGDVVEIRYYDGAEAIKTDLIAGRCNAWLETMPSIYGTLINTPEGEDFEFIGEPMTDPEWFGEGVAIAVRPGEDELIERINAAVDAMYDDGTFQEINDRYFPFYLGRNE